MPDPLADVSVSVCVAPGIQAQFDAVKVARLIRHVNTIVSTIQEAMYPAETQTQSYPDSTFPPPQGMLTFDSFRGDSPGLGTGTGAGQERAIVTAAMRERGIESCAPLSPEGFIAPGQTVSSTHCFVDVTVDLPLISIELLVSDCHSVTLSVTRVETHVLVRQNDLQVYFAVGTLLLLDSLRGADRESIIFTPPLSTEQQKQQKRHKQRRKLLLSPPTTTGTADSSDDFHRQNRGHSFDSELPSTSSALRDTVHRFGCDHLTSSLISVTYTFLYTRQSPLFRNHGQELSIEFSSLGVSIDEEAVRRLKPFVEMLAREMKAGELKATSQSMVSGVASSAPVVAAVGPIGLLVTVSIGSVSLSLMRAQDVTKSPIQVHSHGHCTPIRALSSPSVLEDSYSVEVTDLYSVTDTRHSTAADVRLRSFTVKDCRPVSRGYVYKEMLCRSTLGSEHNSEGHSSIGRKRAQGSKTLQDDDSDILTIAYREESKHAGTVEVEVRNIACFIAVDSVVDLAAVATPNVAAVMEVCVALSGQVAGVEEEERGRATPTRGDADYPYSVLRSAQSSSFSAAVSGKPFSNDSLHMSIRAIPGSAEREMERDGRRGVVPLVRQASLGPRSRISGERAMSFNGSGNTTGNGCNKSNTNTPTRGDRSGVHPSVNSTTATAPFLLHAIVSVVSPRLLLLENPESADSRAIVVRSGVSVHYCNNTKPDAVTMETLHVSLQTLEMFALTGLTQGRPQQIGELRLYYPNVLQVVVEVDKHPALR